MRSVCSIMSTFFTGIYSVFGYLYIWSNLILIQCFESSTLKTRLVFEKKTVYFRRRICGKRILRAVRFSSISHSDGLIIFVRNFSNFSWRHTDGLTSDGWGNCRTLLKFLVINFFNFLSSIFLHKTLNSWWSKDFIGSKIHDFSATDRITHIGNNNDVKLCPKLPQPFKRYTICY